MKKIIIFGLGYNGITLFVDLINKSEYEVIGFADNSIYKQKKYVDGNIVMSAEDLVEFAKIERFSVIIAVKQYMPIILQLEKLGISIEAIFYNNKIYPYTPARFENLDYRNEIKFYAGDIYDDIHMKDKNLYGLSITKADSKHIYHDICSKYPIPDNSVSFYMAEDVLEHIEEKNVIDVINEIYRILKKGALFRICLPDYYSPILKKVVMKDENGNILFDPWGGGNYGKAGVEQGGHLWFPNYNVVREILCRTDFCNKFEICCYHDENEILHMNTIDFSKGYILRLQPEITEKWGIYSIVIDCYK